MKNVKESIYWKNKSNILKIYPYLTNDFSTDVIICGGGIAGAITAYFLAKEGFKVAVFEKNIIGYGQTLGATATLEYQLDMDMYKLEKLKGINTAKSVYNLCLNAIDIIEEIDGNFDRKVGFKRQDAIYFTNKFINKPNILKEYKLRKESGFDIRFLNSHNLLNISSGFLTKNASAIINPYLFTQEIFLYLSSFSNVKVYENTEIKKIYSKNDNVECITNNGFKVKADKLIFASGIDTLKYLNNLNVDIFKTYTVVSKPVINKENLMLEDINFTARDSLEPYHYIRFDNNGRIILTGENIKLTQKFINQRYALSVANEKYKKLSNLMPKFFNSKTNIPIDYMYNTTFVNTKDNLPIIDEIPNMPNCFCNLGFGSNGIIYNVIGASMLKNSIKGLYSKDMEMFNILR